ncbi:MAG: hypothetical protein WA945_05200 [Arcobacteraceae bacterium]
MDDLIIIAQCRFHY